MLEPLSHDHHLRLRKVVKTPVPVSASKASAKSAAKGAPLKAGSLPIVVEAEGSSATAPPPSAEAGGSEGSAAEEEDA